ncbi:gamma-glutamyl phosphate reductase [Spathaspora passalidarum NRRL Y-27907]|uniref:glutamate-5-semialdehyde dehydrogenase n=1 Tax=Spathaspora passalidarum (strain NRRL Y-27907 / 11-Y1) TaxID=619300 RepID=G3ARX4_SPAPN|nr:gamma-glutamyl phosphate reductase [Spathaspora passalidarum NRRL Y-27907]EGW31823.1 gamma-glutamyl phosphate reductase [Spathaspora passalidarum NRRL Y-27907]
MSAESIAKAANLAFSSLKTLSNTQRSTALQKIHDALAAHKDQVLEANKLDMDAAIEHKFSSSLIKRLDLSSPGKYDGMLQGILDVANLEDPVGKITLAKKIDEGLNLYRVTAPIGVLLIIFESRPEVIANITALAIKSGNSAILKGGKESYQTFKIMSDIVNETLAKDTDVPKDAIQLIQSREDVADLLSQDKYIDLVIPRGSNALVRNIKSNTKIPVLGHADGICSIYVDENFDIVKAKRIVVDAKTNYPAGCNAVEQLLFNKNIPVEQINEILQTLIAAKVTIHVTEQVKQILTIGESEYIKDAEEDAFDKEWLSLDISVDLIDNVSAAIAHINLHSSKHTDCIITEDKAKANLFLHGVDSAGIYWNASTRFADGFRYGFGTEVGISTNKIHARGPVGLEGLMSYQYHLKGDGHIASEYVGAGGRKHFIHEDIKL